MTRAANAIDFWRGFALVTIFVNHIPGNFYEHFTHRNIGVSDSAELFVFLAGWGLQIVAKRQRENMRYLMWWLGSRVLKIYSAQILIISLAIAMLASSSIYFDNPLLTTWHNAEAIFYDPLRANIGLVTLGHQLGYFNILPLYVVLTMVAPLIVTIDRFLPRALLPLSFLLYISALILEVNLPSWPVKGQWFFNPLTWQFIFVLGYVIGRDLDSVFNPRRYLKVLRPAALFVVVLVMLAVVNHWMPDPTAAPTPRLLFIDYKPFETPMRVIHFLCLVTVFSAAYPYVERYAAVLTRYLSMLGRHSLSVFCVGSLLSLAGQIARYGFGGSLPMDTLMVVTGLIALTITGLLADFSRAGAKK